ncbi:uncharacterized protein [Triticum aestivum]|uniref:uncharacterized protein isoform X1 n=1 Tax=Triticum aestivum TaxID=4565 RepID=UPI001D01F50E|nr:uncharacterized protein LOC123043395 isoform X1 [Triticum aestivum]
MVDTGFIRVDQTSTPRVSYYTGVCIKALIEEDTILVNGKRLYGSMPAKASNQAINGHQCQLEGITGQCKAWIIDRIEEYRKSMEEETRDFYAAGATSADFTVHTLREHEAKMIQKAAKHRIELVAYMKGKGYYEHVEKLNCSLEEMSSMIAGLRFSMGNCFDAVGDRTLENNMSIDEGQFSMTGKRSSTGVNGRYLLLRPGSTSGFALSDLNNSSYRNEHDLLVQEREEAIFFEESRLSFDKHDHLDQDIVYVPDNARKRARAVSSSSDEDSDEFELELLKKHIINEKCGTSPFDIGAKYPTFGTGSSELAYQNLIDCSRTIKSRIWVELARPTEIKLDGNTIFELLKPGRRMNYVGFDKFCRISREYESRWCLSGDNSRWRHFLHPMLSGSILHTTNPWFKKPINDLFVGEHIGYDVESCKMLFGPYQENDKSWVLYIFDRIEKKLHVLDPALT